MNLSDRDRPSRQERWLLALLGLAIVVAIGFQLGGRALYEPDEGRNAEVMREMSASGDYFVPRLNGLLFLDKPFLYYAAGGFAMRLLGAGEVAARLPGVLSTLALALAVGALARRWWGPRAGRLAALAFAATPLPLLYSQIVIFDAMLALWIAVAVMAFYLTIERADEPAGAVRGSRSIWAWIAWAAMGLGVVTKGPVALLVPLAVALPWGFWRRRARRLVGGGAPLALVGVVVPWLWLVSRADPQFLHYALVTETWSRLTSNELKRDAPVWYYLPVALLGALPWSLVPLAGWKDLAARWRERTEPARFLLLWFLLPFLLFSFMHSKRVHYVLPLFPALLLLSIGIWLRRPEGSRLPGVRAAGAIWAALGAALVAVGLGAAPKLLSRAEEIPQEVLTRTALALGLAWAVAGLAALLSSRSLPRAFFALNLPAAALLVATAPLGAAIGEQRSARSLAAEIRRASPATIEVVAVEAFPASLPFYLGRPVVLESVDGAHLRSNYILRRYSEMVSDEGPLRPPSWLATALLDCETPRLFVVRRRNEGVQKLLSATGRPMLEGGRDHVLFGLCAEGAASSGALATVVGEELAAKPPAELPPPSPLKVDRVPE